MKPRRSDSEYARFSESMNAILKADPNAVKAAMDAERRERAIETERTGKRGRGRPPKHSASSRVSSEKD